jgi:hypothetical protein
MDIDEIRRANLKVLERELGKPKLMAEAAGMSYAQYVNYRDGAFDKRSGKKRGMRKETAWRFEDACKRPRGWLDQVHSADALTATEFPLVTSPLPLTDLVDLLIERINAIDDDEHRAVVGQRLQTLANAPDSAKARNAVLETLALSDVATVKRVDEGNRVSIRNEMQAQTANRKQG